MSDEVKCPDCGAEYEIILEKVYGGTGSHNPHTPYECIANLKAERDRLREACKKALTCGLDSSVREVVRRALAEKGKG